MRNVVRLVILLLLTLPLAAAKRNFSYIYQRAGQSYILAGGININSLGQIQKRWTGDYIWFQRNGQEWLIRDRAVLDEVARAFRPLDPINARYEALHARMRPLEEREEDVESRIDDLEEKIDAETDDRDDDEIDRAAVRRWEDQLRGLEAERRTFESRLRELEREEEVIDREQERLEAIAEAELVKIVDRAIRDGVAQRQ